MRRLAVLSASLVVASCGVTGEDVEFDGDGVATDESAISVPACPSGAEVCSGVGGTAWVSLARVGATATHAGRLAQTFVVTRPGEPSEARLYLRQLRALPSGVDAKVTVDVRRVVGGVVPSASSSTLATGSILLSELAPAGELHAFTLVPPGTSSPTTLQPTETYALVVSSSTPTSGVALVGVASHQSSTYAGGEALRSGVQGSTATPFTAVLPDTDLVFSLKLTDQKKVSAAVTGLSGTLGLRLDGTENLTASANGTYDFVKRYDTGQSYAVTITSQPAGQNCSLSNASGTIGGTDVTVSATCVTPIVFNNNQTATYAIGQSSLTTNAGFVTNGTNLWVPQGRPLLAGGKFFVNDQNNNRILRYAGLPPSSPGSPDGVIGQTDYVTKTTGTAANKLNRVWEIASDGVKLAATDYNNTRVLLYDIASLPSSNASAEVILGGSPSCTASTFFSPAGLVLASGKLIVADTQANRVLIWNTRPTAGNTPANVVLGRANFTSCSGSGLTQNAMNGPTAVESDGTRLFVSDRFNRRVLIWNTIPTTSNTPPDVVVGQPNFTTAGSSASQTTLVDPMGLTVQGGQLAVADGAGNRVLIWNTIPTTNGAPADRVLGQSNFTSTSTSGITASNFDFPTGVLFLPGKLVVSDTSHNRVLVFLGQ